MQIKKTDREEIKSTAHSRYRCQYHIVFAPKYRRKTIYGQLKRDIGEILRTLCKQKNVEIIEAEACPDHIHMLVSIPPYLSVAQFMGFLKGKSSLMIFDRHANTSTGQEISGAEATMWILWGVIKRSLQNISAINWRRTTPQTRRA